MRRQILNHRATREPLAVFFLRWSSGIAVETWRRRLKRHLDSVARVAPSEPAGLLTRLPLRLAGPRVGLLSAEAAPCVGTVLSEIVLPALSRLLSPCLGTAEGDADERHRVSSAKETLRRGGGPWGSDAAPGPGLTLMRPGFPGIPGAPPQRSPSLQLAPGSLPCPGTPAQASPGWTEGLPGLSERTCPFSSLRLARRRC